MNSNEWVKFKFREIAELRKEQVPANGKEQLYIGLEHIEQQNLRLNGVGSSLGLASGKFKFYKNDILYGKLRPYFRKVYYANFEGVCSTEIFVIKNRENIDKHFLYYLIATEEFSRIANSGSIGTHMPRADWNQLSETEWQIPKDEKIQNRIGNILFSLDKKIENNYQTNQTLEEIARTIFKEWFVNFNYPNADGSRKHSELGEIPEIWEVGRLGDIYKTTSGGTPSRSKPEYYERGTIGWIKSKELNNTFILDTEEKITEAALTNSSAKLIAKHSVLIAMYGATVGEIGITAQDFTCNQAICAFLPNENFPYTFIYHFLLQSKQDIIGQAVGSAQQNISQQLLLQYKLVIPPSVLAKDFHKIVEPLFEKIKDNIEENETLKEIRDGLLPKLMKGEIKV